MSNAKLSASAALAAIWLASTAAAQAAAADPAKAAAQALIDEQKAGEAFVALANPNARLVAHRQSGMLCLFANGTKAELTLFAKDGSDVGCEQIQSNGVKLAMFATYRPTDDLDKVFEGTVGSMYLWAWSSKPTPGKDLQFTGAEGAPYKRRSNVFLGDLRGTRTMARIAVSKTPDGWMIVERFIAPVSVGGNDEQRSVFDGVVGAETVFTQTLLAMAAQRSANQKNNRPEGTTK